MAEKETEVGRDGEQVSSSDDSNDQQGELGSRNATHGVRASGVWDTENARASFRVGLAGDDRRVRTHAAFAPLFFATARSILSLGVTVLQERRMTVLVDV